MCLHRIYTSCKHGFFVGYGQAPLFQVISTFSHGIIVRETYSTQASESTLFRSGFIVWLFPSPVSYSCAYSNIYTFHSVITVFLLFCVCVCLPRVILFHPVHLLAFDVDLSHLSFAPKIGIISISVAHCRYAKNYYFI